jgi:hypothetical protein
MGAIVDLARSKAALLAQRLRCPAALGQLTDVGTACRAAAGPLHPDADRPLPRSPGHLPAPTAAASRAPRGSAGRPAAVLDPTAAPADR